MEMNLAQKLIAVLFLSLPFLGVFLRLYLDPSPILKKHPHWIEVVNGTQEHSLKGKTVVFTGGTDGIGVEVTKALYFLGARVIVGARNLEKAGQVFREIQSEYGKTGGSLEARYLDVSSMTSVSRFGETIKVPVDVLVLNAGAMLFDYQTSVDGYEMMFATNYLGHFYLTQKLMDNLIEAKTSRVVYVTSYSPVIMATSTEKLLLKNINNFTKQEFESRLALLGPLEMYGNAKAAGILFVRELAKQSAVFGIHSYAVHPGFVASSIGMERLPATASSFQKLNAYLVKFGQRFFFALLPGLKSLAQGAAPIVYCATSPLVADSSGKYYEDMEEQPSTNATQDDALSDELWHWSLNVYQEHEDKLVLEKISQASKRNR